MIRNRYNYPTPPIRYIKGKQTQTRNNWTLMETSLAESQTDSYFPTKWPHGYPKQKDLSDTHIQKRTITKINHDRRTALERSVDVPSDWRPGGRGFNPRRGRQHSFVEIDHEIFSTVILSLPLIQEGQLLVSGERMCTILVNRLED